MLRTLLIFYFLLINFSLLAQIKVGTWREHFSYNQIIHFAASENKLFASTKSAVLVVDTKTNNIERFSKTNKLSEVDISSIAYDVNSQKLIIAYRNASVDIIDSKSTKKISSLKENNLNKSKSINHIFVDNLTAFLSTNYGILSLDMNSSQFLNTHLPTEKNIIQTTVFNNQLIAATEDELFFAHLSNSFPLNWSSIPVNQKVIQLVNSQNEIIILCSNDIFSLKNNNLEKKILSLSSKIPNKIEAHFDNFAFIYDEKVELFDKNFQPLNKSLQIKANAIINTPNNELFIASDEHPLIKWNPNNNAVSDFSPTTISTNDIKKIRCKNGQLLALSQNAVHTFINEQWRNFPLSIQNLSDADFYESSPDKIIFSSTSDGLFMIENGQITVIDKETKGISNIFIDKENNTYIAHNSNISVVSPNFTKQKTSWQTAENISGIFEDLYSKLWITTQNDGVFVVDKKKLNTQQRHFYPNTSTGYADTKKVNDFTTSSNGDVLLATQYGPVFYQNEVVSSILTTPNTGGFHHSRAGEDEPLYIYSVLGSEEIIAIETDAADRKWIATSSGGVFLVDEDNFTQIKHFNSENSPLPSNKIIDIEIDNLSGEVYFLTEYGIVSYRSDAVSTFDYFSNVYVYPNPVRADFQDNITITGLMSESTIHITDISGNLVYTAKAIGGQVIWDGRTRTNSRAATGIYLVFCTNSDGSKRKVTKFLIIGK